MNNFDVRYCGVSVTTELVTEALLSKREPHVCHFLTVIWLYRIIKTRTTIWAPKPIANCGNTLEMLVLRHVYRRLTIMQLLMTESICQTCRRRQPLSSLHYTYKRRFFRYAKRLSGAISSGEKEVIGLLSSFIANTACIWLSRQHVTSRFASRLRPASRSQRNLTRLVLSQETVYYKLWS